MALARLANVRDILAAAEVQTPSALQPPYKLSHLAGNRSDLAKRKLERGREGGRRGKGKDGRMGRGFLTEPGAVTVRKDCYAIFTEPPRPRRDFISCSSGTGKRQ